MFEVDERGQIVSSLHTRRTPSWDGCGLYRAMPSDTVAGEADSIPTGLWPEFDA